MVNILKKVNLLIKSKYNVSLCMLPPICFGMEVEDNIKKNDNDFIVPLKDEGKNKIRDFFHDSYLEEIFKREVVSFTDKVNIVKKTFKAQCINDEYCLIDFIKKNCLNQDFWFSVFRNDKKELNKFFYYEFDKRLYNVILSKLNEKNDFKDIKNENININQNNNGCLCGKKYYFCKNLGSGGFSNVILAGLKEIKTIPGNKDIKQLERRKISIYKDKKAFKISKNDEYFENECKILSKCDHPNIIKCYFSNVVKKGSLDIKEDIACLSLEYCHNGNLWKLANGCISIYLECLLCYVTGQVLKGLSYLHNNNIVHFDIKPFNILVDENLDVKIADFSISKEYPGNNSLSENMLFPKGGTEYYKAPEIINKAKVLKKEDFFKPDVYSWGVSLYRILTGDCPYRKTDNNKDYNYKSVVINYQKLKEMSVTPVFTDFLERCLIYDVVNRPTVLELMKHQFISELYPLLEKAKANQDKSKKICSFLVDEYRNYMSIAKKYTIEEIKIGNDIKHKLVLCERNDNINENNNTKNIKDVEEKNINKKVVKIFSIIKQDNNIINPPKEDKKDKKLIGKKRELSKKN